MDVRSEWDRETTPTAASRIPADRMRIAELRRREDFDGILERTLSTAWSQQQERPVRVNTSGTHAGQTFLFLPTAGFFYTPDVARAARQFIADSFRFTPVRNRLPFQFALGTLLRSGWWLRRLGRSGFVVDPPLPNADRLLIYPGNRRIRLFDFERQTTRAILKTGFRSAGFTTEIRLRATGSDGPFPRIEAYDREAGWFEERLIPGVTLPRCAPWRDLPGYEASAMKHLARWLAATSEAADVDGYVAELAEHTVRAAARLPEGSWTGVPERVGAWITALSERARRLPSLRLAQTHGDFQPGNVLIESATERVLLIDWEYSAKRFDGYDGLVYGLRARARKGLAARLVSFAATGELYGSRVLFPSVADRGWRLAALALFLMEELRWLIEDDLAGPYREPSLGLMQLIDELAHFEPSLAGLFEG